MKTISFKILTLICITCASLLFSSFKPGTERTMAAKYNYEEYNKVETFVWDNICTPIRTKLTEAKSKSTVKYFSRCPSGYHPDFITVTDSVTPNRYVNGKIVFYKGCVANDVCYFKVCVDKGFAVVRSKGSKEYMSVNEWIRRKNEPAKQAIKS